MDQLPLWMNVAIAIGGAIGTLVTAVATFFLWRVTKTLAHETTRMVDAAAVACRSDANAQSLVNATL